MLTPWICLSDFLPSQKGLCTPGRLGGDWGGEGTNREKKWRELEEGKRGDSALPSSYYLEKVLILRRWHKTQRRRYKFRTEIKGPEGLVMTHMQGFNGKESSSQGRGRKATEKAGKQHNASLHSTSCPRVLWRSLEERKSSVDSLLGLRCNCYFTECINPHICKIFHTGSKQYFGAGRV